MVNGNEKEKPTTTTDSRAVARLTDWHRGLGVSTGMLPMKKN